MEDVDNLINQLIERPWAMFFPEEFDYRRSTLDLTNFFVKAYKETNPSSTHTPLIPEDFDCEQAWELLEVSLGQDLLVELTQSLDQQLTDTPTTSTQTPDYDTLLNEGDLSYTHHSKEGISDEVDEADLKGLDEEDLEGLDEEELEGLGEEDLEGSDEEDLEGLDEEYLDDQETGENEEGVHTDGLGEISGDNHSMKNSNDDFDIDEELKDVSDDESLNDKQDKDYLTHFKNISKGDKAQEHTHIPSDDEDSTMGFPVADDWDDDVLDQMLDELESHSTPHTSSEKASKSSKTTHTSSISPHTSSDTPHTLKERPKKRKSLAVNDEFFNMDEMEEFVRDAEAEANQQDEVNEEDELESSEEDENLVLQALEEDDTKPQWDYETFFGDEGKSVDTSTTAPRKIVAPSAGDKVESDPKKTHTQYDPVMSLTQERQKLNDLISSLEGEAISSKHWSLKGEISSKQRPLNSLLELHLDIPRYYHNISPDAQKHLSNEEDTHNSTDALETLIKKRISMQQFDDVEKIVATLPHEEANKPDTQEESLDFKKSAIGLSDLYANIYLEQQSQLEPKPDNAFFISDTTKEEKKRLTDTLLLFHKVMTKLDSLSHHHGAHLPPSIKHPGAINQSSDVPILQIEEAVPIIMASKSTHTTSTHDQDNAKNVLNNKEELQRSEKRALRNKQKQKKRKNLINNVEIGKLSVKKYRERKEGVQAKKDLTDAQIEQRRTKGLAIGKF